MDDSLCCRFFLEPSCPQQRQYEALRAVFIGHERQKDVAEHCGYDYAAFRQLVGQFRDGCAQGQPPPFSELRDQDHNRGHTLQPPAGPSARPPPTARPSAWLQGDACGRAWQVSFSSGRCWPGSTSRTSCVRPDTPAPA